MYKERWSAMLILDKDDFRTGNITRRKGVLIHTEEKTVLKYAEALL